MADVRLYMNKVNGWEKMDTAMTVNDAEVAHLGFKLPKLRDNAKQMRGLYARHAALAAERQSITQEMQKLVDEGDQIFRMLREAVKDHYGKRNEKLVEFGVEPVRTATIQRRRRESKKQKEAAAAAQLPAESPAPALDSVK
jgi:hypothetical protein